MNPSNSDRSDTSYQYTFRRKTSELTLEDLRTENTQTDEILQLKQQIQDLRQQLSQDSIFYLSLAETAKQRESAHSLLAKSETDKKLLEFKDKFSKSSNDTQKTQEEYSLLKQKYFDMKLQHSEAISELKDRKSQLESQLEDLKLSYIILHDKELTNLKREENSLKTRLRSDLQRISEEQELEKKQIKRKLDAKDTLIENLENELSSIQYEYRTMTAKTYETIEQLQNGIQESQEEIQNHEAEATVLLVQQDDIQEEHKKLSQETKFLGIGLEKELKINKKLKERLWRLEKSVHSKSKYKYLN